MRSVLAATVVFAAALALGYGAAVAWIPYAATDQLFRQFQAAGRRPNTLSVPAVRNARRNLVVRDNADTLTQSAMVDLKNGPLIYRTVVPADAVYWSVSLFAHDTDTYFVANDRTLGPGPFSLLIFRAGRAPPATTTRAVAASPSRWSFLIVRYTMRDRNDAAQIAGMKQELAASTLAPVLAERLAP